MNVDIEKKAHAKFSASSSKRWLTCGGSIALSEKAPPQRDSAWSTEGTKAHACLESVLKAHIGGGKPYSTAKALEKSHPAEMVRHVLNAYKWIEGQIPEGAKVISELKVDASAFTCPGQFGTLDCAIIEYFGQLTVIDFKYGAGIAVSPDENPQLIYYALAILEQYGWDFESVRLVVIQPRAVGEKAVKEWTTTIEVMQEWKQKFLDGVKAALKPDAPLVAFDPNIHGEDNHCRFCPAAVICPALRDQSIKDVMGDFDNETGQVMVPADAPSKVVPIKNLGTILTACGRLELWIEKVREHALHALETGSQVQGWKLVQKRSTRKWINREKAEREARKKFGDLAFSEPEFLSPAQLEKIDAKDAKTWVAKRVTDESSGVTIAPASDKREAYNLFEAEFAPVKKEGKNETDLRLRASDKNKKRKN